ncbi:MAG: hypothetical protein H7095_03535 [Pseudopedobacter sp.]|nr:hypothetical protein [Deinococcales bacterium]
MPTNNEKPLSRTDRGQHSSGKNLLSSLALPEKRRMLETPVPHVSQLNRLAPWGQ